MVKRIAILMSLLLLGGCSDGGQNTDKTKMDTPENDHASVTTAKTEDERVLAMKGVADSEGYYTIDLPRSADDLARLEQINSRLYPISLAMVQTDTKSFEKIEEKLLWRAAYLDISFNQGSISPFNERSDGNSTQINLNNLNSYIKDSFNTDFQLTEENLPKEAALAGELVILPYWKAEGKGVGFVMDAYKFENKRWYIKGEIIAENNEIFSKGEFILEENGTQAITSHKILSFTQEF